VSVAALVAAAVLVVGIDGATVQETIDAAAEGDVVEVPAGEWAGPVLVDRPITLRGTGGVIDGGGQDTVVRISAPGVHLDHLRVRDSGSDRAGPDACIYVEPEAVGATIVDSELTDCLFGIWVHQGRDVRVERNHVVGRLDIGHRSNRGNGIHLFDGANLAVVGNRVESARDGVYVSATEDSLIADNHLSDLRYGLHYMYSWRNTVRGNVARRNVTGIALMESHHLVVTDNVSTDNSDVGLLFRDIQYTRIEGNTVEGNREGLFFFSSLDNELIGNRIAHNQVGARVWAGTERNVVRDNDWIGNRQQVYYVAREDQSWGDGERGNTWSDYLGWDQDADGIGDRPYRVDSFTSSLMYRYPAAALLLDSPALELIERLQERLPALRVPTVIDPTPLTLSEAP
jgi:nitrous oxidase accessory protein